MNKEPAPNPVTLCVDVGGQGVKGLAVKGKATLRGERLRLPTPRPAIPGAVVTTIAQLFDRLRPYDRVSVGFPGVVVDGVVRTAPNLDGVWNGVKIQELLLGRAGVPVRVINDADMHGYGAVQGKGVEIVFTLGTGVGSALFVDGHLLPNVELGHHPFEKCRTYEQRLGQAALEARGRSRWNKRLQRAIALLRSTFNFRCLYLGGGNSRDIAFALPDDVVVVPNSVAFLGGVKLWNTSHRD